MTNKDMMMDKTNINIYYCSECKAMHFENVRDIMYYDNPEKLT